MFGKRSKLYTSACKRVGLLLLTTGLFLTQGTGVSAQELFPLSEPASTIPKGTLGVRLFSETYKEVVQWRNMSYLRLMYGVTPKLSVYASVIASNHHGRKFPDEFPFHNTPERGAIYPYKLNGFWGYAKYRFYSNDDVKSHFRLAAYAELARVKTTHHESEPNLEYGDNSGFGFGLIGTLLENKFAASVTLGAILPFVNKGVATDPVQTLPDVPEKVYYGKAVQIRTSFGYRLLPFHYKSYDQGNLNLYAEIRGYYYGSARVHVFAGTPREYYVDNHIYPEALKRAFYLDFSPGLQYILRSNLRFDASVTFRWLGFSYARLYPVYSVGIQRYFYFGQKSKK